MLQFKINDEVHEKLVNDKENPQGRNKILKANKLFKTIDPLNNSYDLYFNNRKNDPVEKFDYKINLT